MGFPHTRKVQGHTRTSWTALLDYLEDQGIPVPFQVDLVTRLAPLTLASPPAAPETRIQGQGEGEGIPATAGRDGSSGPSSTPSPT